MDSTGCRLRHIRFAGVEQATDRGLRAGKVRGGALGDSFVRNGSAAGGPRRAARLAPVLRTAIAECVDPFIDWLFCEAGLNPVAYRPAALSRRLPACLRALRVSSTDSAKVCLEREPSLLGRAVDALLLGVSGFFRDKRVFEQLSGSVLPELLSGGRGLRVCSAGCSDGQELYSVAMLLEQLGGLAQSYLLGLDCRTNALTRARFGWFPAGELEGVTAELRERFFRLEASGARISPELRQRTRWVQGDLLAPYEPVPAWDLILFRNVGIYLTPQAAASVCERLVGQLRPGAVLASGKAERPPADVPLKRIGPCLYRKAGH